MDLGERDLTDKIIGASIEVHRTLGPGFLESVYEEALVVEFRLRGLQYERQREAPIRYKDAVVGLHRLDLLVEGRIVVELKAVKQVEPVHFLTVRSYLRALDLDHGLILNFNAAPLWIRRVSAVAPSQAEAIPHFPLS